jgi:hypothetical protein
MRNDKLGKFYDRFDPDERLRLVLKAAARGDEEDIERLRDTCPRETYTANDIAFSGRIRGSWKMTMMLCQLLTPSLTKLRTLAAFREALSHTFDHCINEARLAYLKGHEMGVSRGWEAAGKKGDPPPIRLWKEDAQEKNPVMRAELADLHVIADHLREAIAGFLLNELEELERRTVSEALSIWEAFTTFCNEQLQLEPETLVQAWFEPMLHEIEELENLSDPPTPDAKELQKYEEAFKQAWKNMARLP